MKRRFYHSKSSGQSIPLIAVMLVVLFGMAALAMDVGNTYAEQREVVRATNAAAIEGVNKLIDGGSDENIYEQILTSLRSNGVPAADGAPATGEMRVIAEYLDSSGNRIVECPVGECTAAAFETARSRATYIRVQVEGQVETYFAKVVGRNELPVNAVAHARKSICTTGVYPIGVDSSLLDLNARRFDPPDSIYSDEFYRNRTQKRIYLRDVNSPGNFGFMRWRADENSGNSAVNLRDALTGDGNLSEGYREADWPVDRDGNSTVALQKPATGYPFLPSEFSIGDWVAGAAGLMNSNDVREQLDLHIDQRTLLNLPIYDFVDGNGANAVYHVVDIGRFYIRGHGMDRGQPYIDLVYIGPGSQCAGISTPTSNPRNMTLEGQVKVFPHFAQYGDQVDLPIQYVIVLDISGSMSWNFDGQGTSGGNVVQCQGAGTTVQCPAVSPFPAVNERRIKIAHDTLLAFVNTVRSTDQVRLVTFSSTFGSYSSLKSNPPSNNEALNDLSRVYPGSWTSDKTAIRSAIDQAIADASTAGTYVTTGETPSSVGLARALDLYQNAVEIDPVTGKRFKRAVIFLTDGVANVTRNGMLNDECGAENVECQDGTWGPGQPLKPIPAMNAEAASIRALITPEIKGGGDIYTIAMGPTSLEALQQVSGFVAQANSPSALEDTLEYIRNEVTFGTCNDGVTYTSPVQRIDAGGLPDYSLAAIAGRISSPELGYVTLRSSGGQTYTGKILWDSGSGLMYYRITDLPPGSYTMSYWMAFRGEDGVTRIYDYALPLGGGSLPATSQSISLDPSADNFSQSQQIVMDFDPNVDVCQVVP